MNSRTRQMTRSQGYAPINGLQMYYEIEGSGDPLVFIPPAFGFAGMKSFPALIESHMVITVDLQGNGRTADVPERPLSRSEEHTSELQSLMRISYAVFCLKKKIKKRDNIKARKKKHEMQTVSQKNHKPNTITRHT